MFKITYRMVPPKDVVFSSVRRLFSGRNILSGPSIKKFEDELRNYIGVDYAVAVSSARYGLYLILKSLPIRKGVDEVILPAYMPVIVAKVAVLCGLKPVFVDVDPETLNMDPDDVERKITKNTKAIIMVHLYGVPCDIDRIVSIARKHNLFLIEDASQALGAFYKGKRVGSFGDATVFSFNFQKNLTTCGGGVVLTNNKVLYDKIRENINHLPYPSRIELIYRVVRILTDWVLTHPVFFTYFTYPFLRLLVATRLVTLREISDYSFRSVVPLHKMAKMREEEFVEMFGKRFTNIQAEIGLQQLKNYDERLKRGSENIEMLEDFIGKKRVLPKDVVPAYFLYYMFVDNVEMVLKHFFKHGILICGTHYPILPDLDMFSKYSCDCPATRDNAKKVIYLPFRSHLGVENLFRIAKAFNNVVQNKKMVYIPKKLPYRKVSLYGLAEDEED
ncbi:MAG: DegT/DnrJ/EryC1/StrS family aminotransferase [Thermoplasmata archaeon]|nr:DegT/DnrJ/EryC1/StrS family aminotransferase [Thermoplasmata archaeon]